MSEIQDLLDKEANLGNASYAITAKGKPLLKLQQQTVDELAVERRLIHIKIKEKRGTVPMPCWGEDDCSTLMLSKCPWRIDCGDTGDI
jgi:hypothetical protein